MKTEASSGFSSFQMPSDHLSLILIGAAPQRTQGRSHHVDDPFPFKQYTVFDAPGQGNAEKVPAEIMKKRGEHAAGIGVVVDNSVRVSACVVRSLFDETVCIQSSALRGMTFHRTISWVACQGTPHPKSPKLPYRPLRQSWSRPPSSPAA